MIWELGGFCVKEIMANCVKPKTIPGDKYGFECHCREQRELLEGLAACCMVQ